MNGKVQRKHQRSQATARRRQQALLVRAVFGSLVLCAALAPTALAQTTTVAQDATSEVKQFRIPHSGPPFREFLAKMQGLIEAGELNTQDTFDFTVEAKRNSDGTRRDFKLTKAQAGNQRWQALLTEFIMILSDSGALSALQDADHLTITLKLDERASATLHAAVESDEHATQLAQGYNALLGIGRLNRRGRADVEILNNMTVNANGKQLTMQLEMSREQVGNLLRKQLSLP